MTEQQITELTRVANNPILVEALKDFFIESMSLDDVDTNKNNNEVGEDVKAYKKARKIVNDSFKRMEKFTKPPDNTTNINIAR
tara:strand:- start:429 stop:677 length:249 start_codon:yes stop_codon:yes gene_type:complete